jgi:tripartite-type tricarboxylate transporter receptor subunit TctC
VGVYLKDTRLRLIGVSAARRSPVLPSLPTLAEGGLPGFVFESWFGLLAPKGTPAALVEAINAAVNKVIATKEVGERLEHLGIETGYLNVEGFNKLFLADQELMTRIVKESGITRE